MNRFKRLATVLAMVVGFSGGPAIFVGTVTSAQASVSCTSPFDDDFQNFDWTHQTGGVDDVAGVRAGIKFRLDGDLCPYDDSSGSQQIAIWIAVIGNAPGKIVQMGFDKDYNTLGITETCFFWAIQGGRPEKYHCTGMSDDDEENFYIHEWNGSTQYLLEDCGTNTPDYSSCVAENSGQDTWSFPSAQDSEEETLGACDAHSFGAAGDQEKIGSDSGPILPLQGLANSTWTVRSWGMQTDFDGCGDPPYHYQLKQPNPSAGLNWYDNRNGM